MAATNASLSQLRQKLDAILKEFTAENVYVGYTQVYALGVHEDLQAWHPVGQAKFLETPFRQYSKDMITYIKKRTQQTGDLLQSMMDAGQILKGQSQKLCPVDTSSLKASAYVAPESNVENVRSTVQARAEAIRTNELQRREVARRRARGRRRR